MPRDGKHTYVRSGLPEHREERWWSGIEKQVTESVRRLEEKGFFRDEMPRRARAPKDGGSK
jgi:hypothetical protein